MREQSDRKHEGVFDILWFQQNPDDWMAEITDTRSGQKRKVHSVEELVGFVQSRLRIDNTAQLDP